MVVAAVNDLHGENPEQGGRKCKSGYTEIHIHLRETCHLFFLGFCLNPSE